MDVFKIEKEISPIQYAKLIKNKRQRARSKAEKKNPNLTKDLKW